MPSRHEAEMMNGKPKAPQSLTEKGLGDFSWYVKWLRAPYPARTLVETGLRGIDVELVIAADPAIAQWKSLS